MKYFESLNSFTTQNVSGYTWLLKENNTEIKSAQGLFSSDIKKSHVVYVFYWREAVWEKHT